MLVIYTFVLTIKEDKEAMKLKCGQVAQGHGRCKICKCIKSRRGMVVHHYWYLKKGDITHNMFPKNDSGRLEYYTKLLPLIKRNPKRFAYYCNADHQSVTMFCRYGDPKFKALSLERKLSHKR